MNSDRHIVAATPENLASLVMGRSAKGPAPLYHWSPRAAPYMRLLAALVKLAAKLRVPLGLSLMLTALLAGCQDAGQQTGQEQEHGNAPASVSDPLGMAPASPANRGAEQTGTARFLARSGGEPPDVGIPIYPGAHTLTGGTWQLSDQMDEGAETLTTFALFTPHRLATVLEFYRGRLQVDPAAVFAMEGRDGRSVSITVDTPGYTVNLLLRESVVPQGTRIEVSAMAAPVRAPPT